MSDPECVPLPPAVADVLVQLTARGHEAHLVGASVAALLDGEPVRDFEVATSADGSALLQLFERAVPLDPVPQRVALPTGAGPVDLVPHAHGGGICEELAHRDFTVYALAVDAQGCLLDPFAGRTDAAESRLRGVGHASERFAEDPLRALRAARIVATHGFTPAPSLLAALRDAPESVRALPPVRLRGELHALLLGGFAERGLALLRASGIEAALAEGVSADAARIVGALPADLELRLAAWLRGTPMVRTLRRLREPRLRVVAVERLLHLHPIDEVVQPDHEAAFRRLVRRSRALLPGLLALREAEIEVRGEGAAARQRIDRLRSAIERAEAPPVEEPTLALALDGRAVMDLLGCGPGPEIGRALRHLTKAIEVDPACNTPDRLRERLFAWRSGNESN